VNKYCYLVQVCSCDLCYMLRMSSQQPATVPKGAGIFRHHWPDIFMCLAKVRLWGLLWLLFLCHHYHDIFYGSGVGSKKPTVSYSYLRAVCYFEHVWEMFRDVMLRSNGQLRIKFLGQKKKWEGVLQCEIYWMFLKYTLCDFCIPYWPMCIYCIHRSVSSQSHHR